MNAARIPKPLCFDTVFIIGCKGLTEEDWRTHFSPFGEILQVNMKKTPEGEIKGMTHIRFAKESQACAAQEAMHGKQLGNETRAIKVLIAFNRKNLEMDCEEEKLLFRLFVKVPRQRSKEELKEYFSQFGQVVWCHILMDKNTGQSRGLGYVKFAKQSQAALAMEECDEAYCARWADVRLLSESRQPQQQQQQQQQDFGQMGAGGLLGDAPDMGRRGGAGFGRSAMGGDSLGSGMLDIIQAKSRRLQGMVGGFEGATARNRMTGGASEIGMDGVFGRAGGMAKGSLGGGAMGMGGAMGRGMGGALGRGMGGAMGRGMGGAMGRGMGGPLGRGMGGAMGRGMGGAMGRGMGGAIGRGLGMGGGIGGAMSGAMGWEDMEMGAPMGMGGGGFGMGEDLMDDGGASGFGVERDGSFLKKKKEPAKEGDPMYYIETRTELGGSKTLHAKVPEGMTLKQVFALFNICPGLSGCSHNAKTGFAKLQYEDCKCAAYAREKTDGLNYAGQIIQCNFGKISGSKALEETAAQLQTTLIELTTSGNPNPDQINKLVESIQRTTDAIEAQGGEEGEEDMAPDVNDMDTLEMLPWCTVPLPPKKPFARGGKAIAERIFFVSVPETFPSEYLENAFCRFGNLIQCRFQGDKRFGFAHFASKESADLCQKTLHGESILSNSLKVEFASAPSADGQSKMGGERKRPADW